MKWLMLLLQLLPVAGVALYTVNFGRWLQRRHNSSGAYGAYALAAIAFLLSALALLKNNT